MKKRNRELRFEIRVKTQVQDNFGEFPEKWETIREEWFSLEPKRGTEEEQGDSMQSVVTHEARCIWFAGASSEMRLKHQHRLFFVESVVNEHEANRYLVWNVREVRGVISG